MCGHCMGERVWVQYHRDPQPKQTFGFTGSSGSLSRDAFGGATQHSAAQYSAAQRSAAQCKRSTVQRSAAQRSTAHHSTAQHSTAQYIRAYRYANDHFVKTGSGQAQEQLRKERRRFLQGKARSHLQTHLCVRCTQRSFRRLRRRLRHSSVASRRRRRGGGG